MSKPEVPEVPGEAPVLSVIVLNYNTRDILRDCLASVFRHPLTQGTMEVMVVDNASTDGSPDMIRAEFPEVRLIVNSVNLGFAAGNNIGLRQVLGDFILLLNSDTLIFPDTFDRMLATLREDAAIGIVGPQLVNPDGTIQYSAREFPRYSALLFNRKSLFTRLFPRHPWARRYLRPDIALDHPSDTGSVAFAAAMMPKGILTEVGELDERFFMYAEDVDYCHRVHDAGYRIVYNPLSRVIHLDGKSAKRRPVRSIFVHSRSIYKYWLKYNRPNPLSRVVALVALTVRGLFQVAAGQLQAAVGFVRVHFFL